MFKEPYDTFFAKKMIAAHMEKITFQAQAAKLNGSLLNREINLPESLYAVGPENIDIPQFKHPIYIKDFVLIDARTYLRKTDIRGRYRVADQSQLDFDVMRAMLGWLSFTKGSDAIPYDLFGMAVFRTWITDAIVRNKGLTLTDAANQLRLQLIVSLYYHTLFNYDKSGGVYSSAELAAIARRVTNNMANPRLYDETVALFEKLAPMHSLEDLCNNISEHCGDRLLGFNMSLLYTYVGGGWFRDRELVAVALESIPTFLTMLYYSVDSRFYTKTVIGQTAQKVNRRNMGQEFTKAIDKLPVFITP